jgi:phosphoenolpyruvate carboxykinase (GTP)
VSDFDQALLGTQLINQPALDFIREWATHVGAADLQIIDATDDARLTREALDAGEVLPVSGGRIYARSHQKDTARTEERTFVATADPADRGAYNNWRPSSELKPRVTALMKGVASGKTLYAIPYTMAPEGSPLAPWAAGLELTDSRVVALHMIRMTRVGVRYMNELKDPASFVRGVHITGDLDNLKQGTPEDQRHFVTIADERLILHFGSAYGGNALLAKIAHGLRQGSYDGWKSGRFLAEQFMLISIHDRETGETKQICGGFPSASGKTNLAMMVPPAGLNGRYDVRFFGDDVIWLYVDDRSGQLMGFNAEAGVFGVARNSNPETNPNAIAAVGAGGGALFTNVGYNEISQEVWWEGLTPQPPEDLAGWRDWRGMLISERPQAEQRSGTPGAEWAHPNSRFTTALANVPNISDEVNLAAGVPIDAIIFGGRVRDREPLIRAMRGLADGVYDGLTLGAEATSAAEGKEGLLRYDPMSLRPFMSYGEGDYARHWLKTLGTLAHPPVFAHVNWFRQRDGRYLWPGYGENLRPLLWLLDYAAGRVTGHESPVGAIPLVSELNLGGLEIAATDLEELLTVDPRRWEREMHERTTHLAQLLGLPAEITAAHERAVHRFGALP